MGAKGRTTESGTELSFANGRFLDVFSGRFREGDLSVSAGRIRGFAQSSPSGDVYDLHGAWVIPGLIDAHVHIESSQLSPREFARAVIPHGTTCVIADPHEIANVLGLEGIRYMLEATERIPLRAWFMAPSCVPSSPFETGGAVLGADEIAQMLTWDRILGLGELMNYPGVVGGDASVLSKLDAARGRPIDGHAPGLSGEGLWAYVAAGPRTDHECTTMEEAREKLRAGMTILIREGTTARNLDALLPLLSERTAPFVHFCTDDRHPETLLDEGHIDDLVRRAIARGVPAEIAIAAATIHPARTYGLADLGAIAPGYRADLVVLSDLERFEVADVFVGGRHVAGGGVPRFDAESDDDTTVRDSFRIDPARLSFRIEAGDVAEACVRVIDVEEAQIVTGSSTEVVRSQGGEFRADPERDLVKLAVIDRYTGSGRTGVGFARGLGLRRGAIASSVAHDAHNVVVAGATDAEMRRAVDALVRIGGGQVVVEGEDVTSSLSLPIAGLMSDRPLDEVAGRARELTAAVRRLGSELDAPFAALSFLALPVIPHLKLTDLGLVDVDRFELVPLLVEEA